MICKDTKRGTWTVRYWRKNAARQFEMEELMNYAKFILIKRK